MSNNPFSFGIIILAAGYSFRLGGPKQMLEINGTTLLDHAVNTAAATAATHLIVVINDQIKYNSSGVKNLHVIINSQSAAGIATSISTGLIELRRIANSVDAVILMVCDQPFVTKLILDTLAEKFKITAKPIVASSYSGTLGTPVLFHRSYFNRLHALKGDSGAKKIIYENLSDCHVIQFDAGETDIDTPADVEKLKLYK